MPPERDIDRMIDSEIEDWMASKHEPAILTMTQQDFEMGEEGEDA